MKRIIGFVVLLVAVHAPATTPIFVDLTNAVNMADHVLVGTITKTDMIDANGKQVKKSSAMTGACSGLQLRYHVKVATNGVIATSTEPFPSKIIVPEWDKWIMSLNDARRREEKSFIFLLVGTNFNLACPGYSMRELSERTEIEAILKTKRTQNQPARRANPRLAGSDR